MALSSNDLLDLQGTIRYAITHNSPYNGSLNTNKYTSTWDGLAKYTFATLGMGADRVANVWAWVNAHLPADAKKVSADGQSGAAKVGDILDAFVQAAK